MAEAGDNEVVLVVNTETGEAHVVVGKCSDRRRRDLTANMLRRDADQLNATLSMSMGLRG